MQKKNFHGSDLEQIEAAFHIKREDILAFGANVNPLGLSLLMKEKLPSLIDSLTEYPDREYVSLRNNIAAYTGGKFENILVGNGSTELISLILGSREINRALMMIPTYSEYEHELSLAGSQTDYFELKPEHTAEGYRFHTSVEALCDKLTSDYDIFIFCNPNNPTSSAFSRDEVRRILNHCQSRHIMVMVDETYIEFTEDYEERNLICLTEQFDNLVIIRGISKFFAAPGLRLGYAVTSNSALKESVLTRQNPWSINIMADVLTGVMLSDSVYIHKTKALIAEERNYIVNRLSEMKGITFYKPLANFILVRLDDSDASSDALFEFCIRKGLMIRDCSDFPSLNEKYFRFCFLDHSANECLLDTIEEYLCTLQDKKESHS